MCPLLLDETELPLQRTWYLKQLTINIVFWLLAFGILLLVAYYTQATSPFGEE